MKWGQLVCLDKIKPLEITTRMSVQGGLRDRKGLKIEVLSCVLRSLSICSGRLLNPPLVPLAGYVRARFNGMAGAKDILVVFESHTTSHTSTRIGPPVGGTHWDETIWAVTGKI